MQDVLSEITIFGVRDQLRRARSWGVWFAFEVFVRFMRVTRLQVGVVLGFLGCLEVFLRRCWSDLGRWEILLVGFRSPGRPFRWCFVVHGRSWGS